MPELAEVKPIFGRYSSNGNMKKRGIKYSLTETILRSENPNLAYEKGLCLLSIPKSIPSQLLPNLYLILSK